MTAISDNDAKSLHPAVWGIGFTLAMALTGYLERYAGIGRTGAIALIALSSLMLLPMVRSVQRRAVACGVNSPALLEYNRRFMRWTFGYMIALTIGITLYQKMELSGPLLWLSAILPAVPVFGMIWTMARYMREETDEYLRQRTAYAALGATGMLLAVATAWGFLEMFKVVPHIPAWAAFPLWAIGLGIVQFVQARRA